MSKKELEKHVYQRKDTVDLYDESHFIDEEIKKTLADHILKLLSENIEDRPLKILDAGIGGGRLILLPLLDAALKEKIPLEIIGIDNSEPMIQDLRKNLEEKYKGDVSFQDDIDNLQWFSASIKDSTIKIYNNDLDDHKPFLNFKNNFDAVISVLTLHHLKNWRLALYSLTRALKKDGYLFLFEWSQGFKLRDGNFIGCTGEKETFEESPPAVINFWKSFYKERNKYHQWLPEIMASDYSKVNDILKEPFFKLIPQDNLSYLWDERKEVTWKTLQKWIEKKVYSNFYRGLSECEHNRLLLWVKDYLKTDVLNHPTNEKLECKLKIYKKQSDLDNFEKAIILGSIIETSLYEKVIYEQIKENSNNRQLLDLATLLIQHDVITNNTTFFTLNLWDILTTKWNPDDKPLVFNRGLFDNEDEFSKHVASVLIYYAIIDKFEERVISGTKFIFQELLEKPMVTIHKTAASKISRFFIKNIRTKTIEILLPESLLEDRDGYLEGLINTTKNKVKNLRSEVWKPLKEDVWSLIFDNEEVNKLSSDLKDSINEDNLFSLINQEIFQNLFVDLKECFYIEPELIEHTKDKEKQIEKFCITLAFHLLITNWDSMIYVPSEVLLQDKTSKHPFGFGGIILAEENKNNEILKYYLSKRTDMLRIAINIVFRSIGAGQWANKREKDVLELEQKINLTIKLQSHVLSNFPHISMKYIINRLRDQNLDQNERDFVVDYIQERGFYLQSITNQLTTSTKIQDGINICEEIQNIAKYNLFKNTDKSLWQNTTWAELCETNCKTCAYSNVEIIDPGYGKGALYTIFENIIHNALSKGENIQTDIDRGGIKKIKEDFKINIHCEKNQYFILKIGDTTSKFDIVKSKKYFSSDPKVVESDSVGLGIYSIYVAANYLSDKKPILVSSEDGRVIKGCTYTYLFYLPIKK